VLLDQFIFYIRLVQFFIELNFYIKYFAFTKILYIYRYFDETDPDFTLELIMEMEMQKYADQISEISNKATMELNIERVKFFDIDKSQRKLNTLRNFLCFYLVDKRNTRGMDQHGLKRGTS